MPHVRLSVRGLKMICFDCFFLPHTGLLVDGVKALVGFPGLPVELALSRFMRLSLWKAAYVSSVSTA